MSKRVILYLTGGTMSGTFLGGVLKKLEEENFYSKIEAIYGVSVGVFGGVYFLSRKTYLGSSIFWEDLSHDFIKVRNVFLGIPQLIWRRFIGKAKKKHRVAVDIDYLMNVSKNKKPVDKNRIKKSRIKFYSRLFNLSKGQIEDVDARKFDIYDVMKASVCIVPYYPYYQRLGKYNYIDAGMVEAMALGSIIKKYPTRKIVVVFNQPSKRRIDHAIKNIIEGIVSTIMKPSLAWYYFTKEKRLRRELEKLEGLSNVLLVQPPKNNSTKPYTTNRDKLLATFEMGKKEAEKILEFVE